MRRAVCRLICGVVDVLPFNRNSLIHSTNYSFLTQYFRLILHFEILMMNVKQLCLNDYNAVFFFFIIFNLDKGSV